MRVMVMVRATKASEAGAMPTEEMLATMSRFNEELAEAGLILAADGLQPSSQGMRVRFSAGKRSPIEGPFPEKELIAGFWIWRVKSIEEAVEWVERCPDPMPGEESEIEIRPIVEDEDFGEAFTPELREREQRLRARMEQQRTP